MITITVIIIMEEEEKEQSIEQALQQP